MKLKDEMREAAAVALEKVGLPETAERMRAGNDNTWAGGKAIEAALSVCDEYEGVEVQDYPLCDGYLRTRDSGYWKPHQPSFTIYRKKQKPEPDVTELARRAVKEWEHHAPNTGPFGVAMDALAEAVEK